jgi:uncharacterized membrane protein YkvI
MKSLPYVLSVLAVLVLFHTRYTVVAGAGGGKFPGAGYVLDRWTGRVQIISLIGNETSP